jgi:twitching motility protein PilI
MSFASPFDVLLDYERKSLAHVAGMPEQLEAPGLWRGIGFRLGDAMLVSGIFEINEILMMPALANVPGTKAWLLGIANVRGNLLSVVHLRGFLEGEQFKATETTRVLSVRHGNALIGLVVDEVLGQRSFVDEQKRVADFYLDSPVGRFIEAEYQLGNNRFGVFSMAQLLKVPEFLQAAA